MTMKPMFSDPDCPECDFRHCKCGCGLVVHEPPCTQRLYVAHAVIKLHLENLGHDPDQLEQAFEELLAAEPHLYESLYERRTVEEWKRAGLNL